MSHTLHHPQHGQCSQRQLLRWEGYGRTPDGLCQGHPMPHLAITTMTPWQLAAMISSIIPGFDVSWKLRLWQCESSHCFFYEYLFCPAVPNAEESSSRHSSRNLGNVDHHGSTVGSTHTHAHTNTHVDSHANHTQNHGGGQSSAAIGTFYAVLNSHAAQPLQAPFEPVRRTAKTSSLPEALPSSPEASSPESLSSSPSSPSSSSSSSPPSHPSSSFLFSSTPAVGRQHSPASSPNFDDADKRAPLNRNMLDMLTVSGDEGAPEASASVSVNTLAYPGPSAIAAGEPPATPQNPSESRWSRNNDSTGHRNFLQKRKHGVCADHKQSKKKCYCDTSPDGPVDSHRIQGPTSATGTAARL